MNQMASEPGFALRGDALAEVKQSYAVVDGLVRERRLRRLVTIGGGWIVAGMMTTVAAACLAIMWDRPTVQDRVYVSIVHDDGTFDAPKVRDDLPRSLHDTVFRHTVIQYVRDRENYVWESVNGNYRRVSAMSTPAEMARYQAVMLDRKNPDNPAVLYGDGLNAAVVDVVGIQVRTDPATPYAVSAAFVIKITAPGLPPRTLRKTASITWLAAADVIPPDIQQAYDPLGIAFSHYQADLDPEAPR